MNILEGYEVIFILANQQAPEITSNYSTKSQMRKSSLDLNEVFSVNVGHGSPDRFFDTLLAVLEALPMKNVVDSYESSTAKISTHQLVWELLYSMPSNTGIIDRVRSAAQIPFDDNCSSSKTENRKEEDFMIVDTVRKDDEWNYLFESSCFQRSVYVMQVVDSFLQPSTEILSNVTSEKGENHHSQMIQDAA